MGGMDPAGAPMKFFNNTCVARSGGVYTSCSTDSQTGNGQALSNNKYFIPGMTDPDDIAGFPCEKGNWSKWQADGQDSGSTVSGAIPTNEVMAGWGRALLGF
jgi:hypothetical protein